MVGDPGTISDPFARGRLVGALSRASVVYVRDCALISRRGGDLLETLLFSAILDANMAPVTRDPELRVRYGAVAEACPDELRRPVTINAVTQSLGLPFETGRRRVQALVRAGLCEATAKGVIVPRRAVTTPAYNAIQQARYDRTRAFHRELADLGALGDDPGAPAPAEPLVRAANRAVSEYMLRACGELIALTGDIVSSLVLIQLVIANTAELSPERLPVWAGAPQALALPARAASVSRDLAMSAETVRRHALTLEAGGFCRRSPAGLIAACPLHARPQAARFVATNVANVQRLFARLKDLGVVAAWQAEETTTRTVTGRSLSA
jgi:DNA-binding Lrp family transcriptional regulator